MSATGIQLSLGGWLSTGTLCDLRITTQLIQVEDGFHLDLLSVFVGDENTDTAVFAIDTQHLIVRVTPLDAQPHAAAFGIPRDEFMAGEVGDLHLDGEDAAGGRRRDDGEVDGPVIAACSHRAKTEEFKFDPAKVQLERVSLREQVAWSHEPGHEDTQMLAEDLIRMGVTRASKMELAERLDEVLARAERGGEIDGTDRDQEFGIDLKYSLTPSLTLDATVNTDFAQVEADEQRVKITTAGDVTIYELSFPDDDNMVWSTRTGDKVVPTVRWRR